MKIIIFTHPNFMASQSMPRFAKMLKEEYEKRGHQVEMWTARPKVWNFITKSGFKKWAGYIDQYILFPLWVKKALKHRDKDTLFVFCDQALGPWIPLVRDRPHVVHVHDLLALRSALGEVPENPTSWTGRLYQRYIRSGFQQASNFISISKNTKNELHRFCKVAPVKSEVVYNGLNYPYAPLDLIEAQQTLKDAGLPVRPDGMLLHLGGNQWYKNLSGLLKLYAKYVESVSNPLELWCISPEPNAKIRALINDIPSNGKVLFFKGLNNKTLQAAYSHARVFLFPSLAEGFGWPLVEAQACGCPVITTDSPPMNEVAGPAATYLPLLKPDDDADQWATNGANQLISLLSLTEDSRGKLVQAGLEWSTKFDADTAIDGYLKIYQEVLHSQIFQK